MTKADYKQTEVGLIPEDWEVIELRNLTSEIGDGIHATPIYSDRGEYYFVNGNNLENGDIVINPDTKRADAAEYRKYRKNLDERSILLSINGTIGNVAFYTGEPIILGKSAAYLNIKNGTSRKYIYFSLQTNYVTRLFDDALTGTTIKNLGLGAIRTTPIAIPKDKNEQHAIAEALSDVDGLIAGLDKLIAKKRAVKQAAMQQLLTGKTRLPGFGNGRGYKQTEIGQIPEDWQILSVGDIADFANGKPHESSVSKHGLFNLITLDSVDIDGSLKADHKRIDFYDGSLKKNDIVIILSDLAHGNLLGMCDLIPTNGQYVLNQRVGRLRVWEGCSPHYIRLQINRNQNFFKTRGQGTSQKHIYKRDVAALKIPMPELKEQQSISAVLYDMDAEITALEARRAKTQAIKQGMMQELLTGRTRLL